MTANRHNPNLNRLVTVLLLFLFGTFTLTYLSVGVRASSPQPQKKEVALKRFHYTEVHMGVPVGLTVYAAGQEEAEKSCRVAFDRFAALEQVMSDYRPTSELMRLCAKAGQGPVPVSEDLWKVLERSQTLAEESEGAFDITASPIIRLWRTARKDKKLPDPKALEEAKAKVGWRNLRLDPAKRTAELKLPGMQLDLGAIAKGFACDEAQAALKAKGIKSALVEAGGDIVVTDSPPGEEGWKVAVDDETRTLSNVAISTSGDTEQFVEINGTRYSHIVDPRTGYGITSRTVVTITASDGLTSDSLATAFSVLGPEKSSILLAPHYPTIKFTVRFPRNQ